jgi:hypothetical protein
MKSRVTSAVLGAAITLVISAARALPAAAATSGSETVDGVLVKAAL